MVFLKDGTKVESISHPAKGTVRGLLAMSGVERCDSKHSGHARGGHAGLSELSE